MKEIFINENGCISLGSIGCEQDLELGPGTNLNPPPEDGRCECCGRHISQLKPFGRVDHLIYGNLEGELLVKTWRRTLSRPDEGVLKIMEEFDPEKAKKMLIEKYGDEEGEKLETWYSGYVQT